MIAAAANAPRERYRERAGQPRPWRVIEHALSANFQDPNQLLAALRCQLHGGGGTTVLVGAGGAKAAALHGMGGIGKTQLALAYCHAYRDAYSGIWWLRAETARGSSAAADPAVNLAAEPARPNDTLLQQDALSACAAAGVAVPDGVAPSQVLKQWLGGQTAPWLLVFDNADDPHELRAHLPGPGPHHAIITSRRPDWGGLAKTVELATWTAQQGAGFVMRRLGAGTDQAEAEALSHALGGLPLALEQAASYIEATGGTVAQYLRLWQGAAAELLNKHSASTGYELTVAATLSLAFKHLSPAAQQLLRLCAFAAPEPLPERFFTEGFADLPAELGAAAAKPLAWNDVAGELKRYALAQRDSIPALDRAWLAGGQAPVGTATEQALTLHRLTQQVVRDQLAEPLRDVPMLVNVLGRACRNDAQDPRYWPRLASLLPHAVWLNEPGRGVVTEVAVDIQIRSWLLDRTATFLQHGLALYPQARAGFEQVLATRRRVLGEEHPETLDAMNNLANVLSDQGDLAGACCLHDRVLAVCRRALGEEHPSTLTSMNNLAQTRWELGDLIGARSLQEQELAVCRRVLGEEHPDTLTSMSNLANMLNTQGDLASARKLDEQGLSIRRRVLGAEHPSTLTSMNNLAKTLSAQGDSSGARDLWEQVMAGRRRVLGDEHPATLTSMNNLASALCAQGDLAGARTLEERALALRRRVLGDDHHDTLTSMNNLASTLWAQGDLAGARKLQEQALAVRRRVLGEEHPDTLNSMNNLASTLLNQGDLVSARNLHEQVLAVCRQVLGEEHPHTLTSMNNVAGTLWALGDLTGARGFEEQVLAVRRRVLGEDHPDTLNSMNSLAISLRGLGEREDAIVLMTRAARGREATLGAEHPDAKASAASLALMLGGGG